MRTLLQAKQYNFVFNVCVALAASMVGIGFGMLLVGYLLGLAILFVVAQLNSGKRLADLFSPQLFKNESS